MFLAIVFCAFTLARNLPGATTNDCNRTSQPIEDVYPECFRGKEKSGVMVREEDFVPIRGYAVCPFGAPNDNKNHFERRKPDDRILFIVLHYTDKNFDFAATVERFTSNVTDARVSSHYVIAEPAEAGADKQLLQVVPENCVAYHAGKSSWGDRSSINLQSIGIEIVNSGFDPVQRSWDPFHREQIRVAGLTVARMVDQYGVLQHRVIGHADVAPARRIDPGVMFPWAKLYEYYGVGAWLDDDEMDETVVVAKYRPGAPCPRTVDRKLFIRYLRQYGYNVNDEAAAVLAFKAHFTANQMPERYDQNVTTVDMYWIWALAAKYSRV